MLSDGSNIEIAEKYNLPVFEDSAQAMGAKFNGQSAGTIGDWGTYSFYPSKTLGCFGDTGALVTNSDEIFQQVLAMRNLALTKIKLYSIQIFGEQIADLIMFMRLYFHIKWITMKMF